MAAWELGGWVMCLPEFACEDEGLSEERGKVLGALPETDSSQVRGLSRWLMESPPSTRVHKSSLSGWEHRHGDTTSVTATHWPGHMYIYGRPTKPNNEDWQLGTSPYWRYRVPVYKESGDKGPSLQTDWCYRVPVYEQIGVTGYQSTNRLVLQGTSLQIDWC